MIESIIEKLKREPVRVRLYSIVVLVATYLLARGLVSATDLEFIGGIAALILGVERSRAHVSPVSDEEVYEDPELT